MATIVKSCISCQTSDKSRFTKTQWKLPSVKQRKCKSCQAEDLENEQDWKEESEDMQLMDFFGLDIEDIF
jgi:hypothetical protein